MGTSRTRSGARQLARGVSALTGAIVLAAVVLLILGWSVPLPPGSFGFRGFTIVFALTFGTVGAIVASRRPENPIGWLLVVTGLLSAIQEAAHQYALYALIAHHGLPGGAVAAWIPAWIWIPITASITVFLFPIFPEGRLLSRRWRIVPIIGGVGVVVGSLGLGFARGPLENFRAIDNPFGVLPESLFPLYQAGLLLYLFGVLGGFASLAVRFRRSSGDEREQLKWLASSAAIVVLCLGLSFINPSIQGRAQETGWSNVLETLVILSFTTIPIAVAIAVLKYRLYDIDVVIGRTVTYGALAVFITIVYVAVVVGIGAVAGSRGNVVLSGLAAAIVAVAFQPVRRIAQRFANRLVYGRRATPYEVLAGFSQRLGGGYSIDDVLPRMARVLAEGTGAARSSIWLRAGSELRRAASWPTEDGPTPVPLEGGEPPVPRAGERWFPVRHQGELLGALSVAMAPGETLTPVQDKLFSDVAGQAGLVLRNVGLVADLRASRQRLVAAQDEERRRIERDIHDGAQQQLVALTVKLRLLRQSIERGEAAATELADQLSEEAKDALDTLRDLARGVFPPLLADQGLAAALRAQAHKSVIPVRIESADVGRLPRDVEAAAYFCVLEALQNVAKYAEASTATVRLSDGSGQLIFEVHDDGRGFDERTTSRGSGLQNMSDRVAALGGELSVASRPGEGTTVVGKIPTGEGAV